jgi:FtsZ-binding cell division protein ZapB
MQCNYCGKDVPQIAGKRERLYCNDVCKQLAYRKRKATVNTLPVDDMPVNSVQRQSYMEMLAELIELREKVHDQAHTIEELRLEIGQLGYHDRLVRQLQDERETLEQERATLKKQLDFERRFLEDTKAYTFKAWLRKQPSSPWRVKFLSDQLIPPRTSWAGYQAHMKRVGCTDEEMEDFIRLWKLMLSQS